jgi:hypothetical protein
MMNRFHRLVIIMYRVSLPVHVDSSFSLDRDLEQMTMQLCKTQDRGWRCELNLHIQTTVYIIVISNTFYIREHWPLVISLTVSFHHHFRNCFGTLALGTRKMQMVDSVSQSPVPGRQSESKSDCCFFAMHCSGCCSLCLLCRARPRPSPRVHNCVRHPGDSSLLRPRTVKLASQREGRCRTTVSLTRGV